MDPNISVIMRFQCNILLIKYIINVNLFDQNVVEMTVAAQQLECDFLSFRLWLPKFNGWKSMTSNKQN